ncbi:MAG: Flp pilus assembly protein CpaB [Hyphomonadaceae bacterium]
MSARQIIVLALAVVAAIGALFLVRGMGRPAQPANVAAASIPGVRVLVASRDLPQGAALSGGDLQWRAFPQESITQAFVREEAQPSAPSDMSGWVTRRAFVAGEPVTLGSVISPDDRGFMAAQLPPGYRAVSIEIDPDTAAGNFIQPNDRVDIILTTRVEVERDGGGTDREVRTDIVLEDVRVLAIGEHAQTQQSGQAPERVDGGVAVLELSQADSRILAHADALGDLSLALRGVEHEAPGIRAASAGRSAGAFQQNARQMTTSVRIHQYGAATDARGGH